MRCCIRRSFDDSQRLVPDRALSPADPSRDETNGCLHGAGIQPRENIHGPGAAPHRAGIYRVTGVDDTHEMRWTEYAVAMLLFRVYSMLVLYLMHRASAFLPFNPQ